MTDVGFKTSTLPIDVQSQKSEKTNHEKDEAINVNKNEMDEAEKSRQYILKCQRVYAESVLAGISTPSDIS